MELPKKQLNTLTTAINREKLALEQAVKDRKIAEEEILKAIPILDDLNKKITSAGEKLLEIGKSIETAKNEYNEIAGLKMTLEKEVASLDEFKRAAIIEAKEEANEIINEANKAKALIDVEIEKVKTELETAKDSLAKTTEEDQTIKTTAFKLASDNNKLNIEISDKQNNLKEVENAVSEWQDKASKITLDIAGKEARVKELEGDIASLEAIEKETEQSVAATKSELARLETERDAFNTAKFNLAKRIEDLNAREAFIQDKYKKAGIAYN